MILEFDIGNTALKWRLLDVSGLVADRGSLLSTAQLPDIQARTARTSRIRVASVAAQDTTADVEAWALSTLGIDVDLARTEAACAGLTNSYAEPERMGVDRWLAMLAAYVPRHRAVVVIDAGTALTLDFIDANGQHRGGYILPGQALSQAALLSDTSRVRFSEEVVARPEPGRSTAEAVTNGALFAQVAVAESAITQARLFWGSAFSAVLTGGDGEKILSHLGVGLPGCEFVADLVFDGLAIALP